MLITRVFYSGYMRRGLQTDTYGGSANTLWRSHLQNQCKPSRCCGVFGIARIQETRREAWLRAGRWTEIVNGQPAGLVRDSANELEGGGNSKLMILTDSSEVNAFVNTRSQNVARNVAGNTENAARGEREAAAPASSAAAARSGLTGLQNTSPARVGIWR